MRARRKHRAPGIIVVMIVLLAVGGLLALANWVVMPLVVGRGRETVVPNLIGMDRFAAEETLAERGLQLGEIRYAGSGSVPADRVVTQHPAPGQHVKIGRRVSVDVSKGGDKLRVPRLDGLTVARATALLAEAGLPVAGVESLRTPGRPAGQVVGSRPPGGSEVVQGESVYVQVSSRVGNFPMPNLVGLSIETARGIVASQGLVMGELKSAPSDEPAGNVLIQYPEEGMTMRDGDTVSMIVAVGKQ
jgi:eukaryotic-like serine/threonine-protein kinase